jgi:hypothetical protein
MPTSPAPYSLLPIGAGATYIAPAAVPQNCLFLSSRTIDRATVVAGTEVSTLPASYLAGIQPAKKHRTTGKVGQYYNVTLEQAEACDTAAFVAPNWGPSTVVRIYAAETMAAVLAAPALDTGWQSPWPGGEKPVVADWPVFTGLIRWTNTAAYKYWRFEFADPGALLAYFDLGRLFLGQAFQPKFNIGNTPAIGLMSPDIQSRTPYGRTYTDPRGLPSRRLALPLAAVNHDDLVASLFELQSYCGLARDFVFTLDPGATRRDAHLYTLQGLFAEQAQFENQPWWDGDAMTWRTTLTVTEPI